MRTIDRYLFAQLLGPTLLAIAALSGVAILSEALSAIGVVIDQRQSPLIFAKVILLAMPQLVVLILPVAVLVAGLVSLNRLHTEHEIVICFSSGMSRWRVISPAVRLSAIMGIVSLIISLWIQPLCYRALRDTLQNIRADLLTTMIKPGQFTHPAPGLTVYAQSVSDDGDIHNLFIDHQNPGGRDTTITARDGRLQARDGAPVLYLHHGANQEFSAAGVLNFLSFDDYALDLRPLMNTNRDVNYKLSDRYLHELLFPDMRRSWDRGNRVKMLAEAHARLCAALYNVAFMFMALAAVIGGSFSRFGYGTRIAAVAGAALIARTLGFAAQAASASRPELNLLQYAIPLLAIAVSTWVVFGRGGRRARSAPAPSLVARAPVGSPA